MLRSKISIHSLNNKRKMDNVVPELENLDLNKKKAGIF